MLFVSRGKVDRSPRLFRLRRVRRGCPGSKEATEMEAPLGGRERSADVRESKVFLGVGNSDEGARFVPLDLFRSSGMVFGIAIPRIEFG